MQPRPSFPLLLALSAWPLLGLATFACSLTAPSDDELAASCDDDRKNGGETDVDCGGPCGVCGSGRTCATGADCASGACIGDVCETPSCGDGVKNGLETGVDCGGSDFVCEACPVGQGCATDDDCITYLCVNGLCDVACDDGILSGDETDVDCGGSCPDKCQMGQGCFENTDCVSGVCDMDVLICQP